MSTHLWAKAKKSGFPTAASAALDGDVILAAQTLQIGAVIATENVGHLSLLVETKHWWEIP